jgi:hypothetical protein
LELAWLRASLYAAFCVDVGKSEMSVKLSDWGRTLLDDVASCDDLE